MAACRLSLLIPFCFSDSLPVDVLQYIKDRRQLTDEEKYSVLQQEKCSVSINFQFPKTSGRHFNPQWEKKFN